MKDYIDKIERDTSGYINLDDIGVDIAVKNGYVSLTLNGNNFYDLYNVIKYFVNKKYIISGLDFYFKNKNDKGLLELDYTYLHKSVKEVMKNNSNSKIEITYDDFCTCGYEDFVSMIESLNWYRSLIMEYDLSPVEKLTYAYDICKTFEYRSSGESFNDIDNDNRLHLIIKTGNIVCLGYNRLLREIVSGIKGIKYSGFTLKSYDGNGNIRGQHSRGIVRLDDNIYNIHGIYILDPTWDSYFQEYKDEYGKCYDAFSGYRFFLVPIYKYGKYFKRDNYPRIFTDKHNYGQERFLTKKKLDRITKGHKTNNNLVNRKLINDEILPLIYDGMTMGDLYQYLNCDRPDLKTFMDIIAITREAEGYEYEELEGILLLGIDNKKRDMEYIVETDKEQKLVL